MTRAEPIAIVGMACRLPGGASTPEAFWRLLSDGVDAVTTVPADRFVVEAVFDARPGTAGKTYSRWGSFVDQPDAFDAAFFGISEDEAGHMDPQQRLLLEVAWEALEDANIPPRALAGRSDGFFVGSGNSDYDRLSCRDHASIHGYSGIGTSYCVAPSRIAYALDLHGPALAIDTGCSSSIDALALACQALRAGDCEGALVGGVNVILTPEKTLTLAAARMLAADGRCKTFDARADGYVRGEGCAVVVLKRLSDAVRAGDDVQAVVRGYAVNHDGLSNGLTAPNGTAQRALLARALDNAGVEPSAVGWVEAHGTGTALGDAIEVKAIKSVLGAGREADRPCGIGAVKTNIGHLEPAAGVVSLQKVVLSLRHRTIPAHLHLEKSNPHLGIDGTPFYVPTEARAWEPNGDTRIAGVSAFSFCGTNCHVVVEEAPPRAHPPRVDRASHVLTLRATSDAGLRAVARRLQTHLAAHPDLELIDVCHTANVGRGELGARAALVAKDGPGLCEALAAFASAAGEPARRSRAAKVVFARSGAPGRAGFARALYDAHPAIRVATDALLGALDAEADPVRRWLLDAEALDRRAASRALDLWQRAIATVCNEWGLVASGGSRRPRRHDRPRRVDFVGLAGGRCRRRVLPRGRYRLGGLRPTLRRTPGAAADVSVRPPPVLAPGRAAGARATPARVRLPFRQ